MVNHSEQARQMPGAAGLFELFCLMAIALFGVWIALGCACRKQEQASEFRQEAASTGGSAQRSIDKAELSPVVISNFGPDQVGKSPPEGWKEMIFDPEEFPKKSEYGVVGLDHTYVLRAATSGGVSAIYRPVDVNPEEYPYIVWRWRVDQIFEKADGRTRSGDDYPARLYIGFRYLPSRVGLATRAAFEIAKAKSTHKRYPPLFVLNYVWANRLGQNTWMSNPWEERSKMIAVRSGKKGLHSWHWEARDYVRDFKTIVGKEPPPVEFVAIMIDGDGTGSSGVAYFDRIELRAKAPGGVIVEKLQSPGAKKTQ